MSVEYLSSLSRRPDHVAWPLYDRAKVKTGIVHFGPGAFHRAHQAPAFDAILARDPRWGIVGVSLHSREVRDALGPQEGLYTLALLDENISFRVIGAIKEIIVAPEEPERVLDTLAAPDTQIATLTITEKGYCLNAAGELDLLHRDIKSDIATPQHPSSAIGYLVEGLFRRYQAKLAPFAVISCDNLVNNGRKLASVIAALALAQDREAEFLHWLTHGLVAPCTMVDSITPATDEALRERVATALGVGDRWPVQREAFTQWVIEDLPNLPKLDWTAAGVTLTSDVSAFERAKLRILNASHSSLAYLGLLKHIETVAEAIADPELAGFVRELMEKDVTPSLTLPADFDLPAYREAVLKRFSNPAMRHLLSQIAWDGSQKLPNRLFGLIEEALAAGRDVSRPARTVAGWFRFLKGKADTGDKLVDPLAHLLIETARQASNDPPEDVSLFLTLDLFPDALAESDIFFNALVKQYTSLIQQS